MFADIRKIITLAWPVLIGQLAIIAFGVIDTAMVGRFSALDLAALGLGSSIYVSVYIGLTGILTALQPIAAQLFGAHRYQEIGEEVRQSLWLALALALLGFVVLYFPEPLLNIARAPEALRERTQTYLRILSFGLPASLVFRVYGSVANAIGKPRLVMVLQIGALLIKFPLNTLLIFGGLGIPALGGPGCALASLAINWTLALVGMLLLTCHEVFAPFAISARFCWPAWRRQAALLRLGLPLGLSYLIEVTSYTFMALFITRFGTTALAGHQIAGNIGAVLYMTPLSLGVAVSTLVAQALGAGRAAAAQTLARHGILLACALACCYGVLVMALRPWLISAYTLNLQVIASATSLVALVVCYHVFDALQVITAFVLRAYKVAVVPTLIYAVALWGVGLGGGYVLGFNLTGLTPAALTGAPGFWLANLISLAIAGIGLLFYWRTVSARYLRTRPGASDNLGI
ncbi:MATE family efflux transporter [Paraburkholderia hayleyella]|uniref:MATE family efflux transporter n=1 Tax=Paraburkholderia hayleyella TaxID=2152889 RepID=UPI0012928E8D|nr:MATE family efflux transporter [Paraburkholderia hayleyella]